MSKYVKIYNDLITRAQSRNITGYSERHHIIPKCLGGSNDKDNLVRLTAREHFVAHQLLIKIYPKESSLIYAANMMCVSSLTHVGNRSSNRRYDWLKRLMCDDVSKRRKGTIASVETKLKMSESGSGENNSMYGKTHSEESKQKMSKNRKGKRIGYKYSEESIQKKKETFKKNNHPVECPHCGKIGTGGTMKRFHFDNCGKDRKVECPHCKKIGDKGSMKRYHFDNCGKDLSIQCPHCGKIGSGGVMKRYHFDNCKHKPSE